MRTKDNQKQQRQEAIFSSEKKLEPPEHSSWRKTAQMDTKAGHTGSIPGPGRPHVSQDNY